MTCGALQVVDRLHKVDEIVPQILEGGHPPVTGHNVLDLPLLVEDGDAGDEAQTVRLTVHAGELHHLFSALDYLGYSGIGKVGAGLQQIGDPLAEDLL